MCLGEGAGLDSVLAAVTVDPPKLFWRWTTWCSSTLKSAKGLVLFVCFSVYFNHAWPCFSWRPALWSLQRLNDESILRSQLDMKTPHHSVSGRSFMASTPDSSNIAVFEVRIFLLLLTVVHAYYSWICPSRVIGFGWRNVPVEWQRSMASQRISLLR